MAPIYMQRILHLNGTELNSEIREKQAIHTIKMCEDFVKYYPSFCAGQPQQGIESFYNKRSYEDSEIDIRKSIAEQFDLLRTVDNEEYPAFFEFRGRKYKIKIYGE